VARLGLVTAGRQCREVLAAQEAHAKHMGGIAAQPAEYERRVVGFFDRELLGKAAR
jgi:hypothetical protein